MLVQIRREPLGQHDLGQRGQLDLIAETSLLGYGAAQSHGIEEAFDLARIAACAVREQAGDLSADAQGLLDRRRNDA